MIQAQSDSKAPQNPTASQLPDALPTEGAQIAVAWVVFGSLTAGVVAVLLVLAAMVP